MKFHTEVLRHSGWLYLSIQDVLGTHAASTESQLQIYRPFKPYREDIKDTRGVRGDAAFHSRCVPGEVKAEWTAEVICKPRENMMVLNLALGRLQGPHHCTVVVIIHTQSLADHHLLLIIPCGGNVCGCINIYNLTHIPVLKVMHASGVFTAHLCPGTPFMKIITQVCFHHLWGHFIFRRLTLTVTPNLLDFNPYIIKSSYCPKIKLFT